MNYKLQITSNISDTLYQQALTDYDRLFPGDPSLYLINLDHYMLKGDMKKTLTCINKLNAAVDGDVYLDLYQGIVYSAMGEQAKGLKLIDNYIKENKKDPNGYWMRFQVYLMDGNDVEAIKVLEEMNRYTMFSRRLISYKIETTYPDFAETLDFLEWKDKWISHYREQNQWKSEAKKKKK